ncbi:hypothetical protein ABIA39_007955 [Nocardia sp. GAS34]|uniref:serine/threonine-protein kinase n=1 Tax=unclassified Nocardia TaxID=2637762 RepID=UPI003D1FCAAE
MTGHRFGTYRLDRLIGRGSAGEVWLAQDTVAGRSVALKILSVTAGQDPDYRRRFEREAAIGARLDNPHVVPIHTYGEVDGRLFLDMAHIPGVDVAGRLRVGPMDAARAVDLVAQVAQALDAAHAAGLVHRDVKPANIIVHASGFAYLIDFGIAHVSNQTNITATGFTVGTMAYMAPERFTGSADARSDIYSLACVLYECLTAQRPFGDTDPVQQLHAHLKEDPPRADSAPAALNDVIARGMAKQPADRYRSAGELAAAALAAIGMAQPISRTPPVLEQPSATRRLPATAATGRAAAATGYPVETEPDTGSPGAQPNQTVPPAAGPARTRTMTVMDGPVPRGPAPTRAHPWQAGPLPTRVLANPDPPPPTGAPAVLVSAPAARRHPLLTARALGIVAGAIILAILVFVVVAAFTALLSSGGQAPTQPEVTTTISAAPTTTETPTPTTESTPPGLSQAPLSIPVAPGFTLTFQIPVPSGMSIPPAPGNQ